MPIKEKDNVTWDDRVRIQTLGRTYVRYNRLEDIEEAAQYLCTTLNVTEAEAVLFWWEEGVRNTTKSQDDTNWYVGELPRFAHRVHEITTERLRDIRQAKARRRAFR